MSSLSLYLFATGELAESASQFRVSSRRLERKMWWKNCKVLVGNNRSFLLYYPTVKAYTRRNRGHNFINSNR